MSGSASRQPQDLAACALCDSVFSPGGPRFLSRYTPGICERYEVALPSIDGEQISHHFPSNGQRRSIGVPFLFLSFIEQRKIVILSGRQLRCLDQHKLDILVALFGNRCANRLLGRASFVTAEPAITDRLSDRSEARNLAHLQSPGQCSNGPNSGNSSKPLDSLGQEGISLQRTHKSALRFLQSRDRIPAQSEQRPNTLIHFFVAREQASPLLSRSVAGPGSLRAV